MSGMLEKGSTRSPRAPLEFQIDSRAYVGINYRTPRTKILCSIPAIIYIHIHKNLNIKKITFLLSINTNLEACIKYKKLN